MLYKNARIFCSDGLFRTGAFRVTEDGHFGEILPGHTPEDGIDLKNAKVIPGLVDVHIHGAAGQDFSDGDPEGIQKMARYLASRGVTSFAPASMTLPYEQLQKIFSSAKVLAEAPLSNGARLLGIHMEGPYFSEKKKGAQNGAYLKMPDFEGFRALYEGCKGLVSIVDVAPELPGAEEFIQKAKALCTVSLAHTDADYEAAKAGIEAGATHVTHLFNAMPGIHHRQPGVIPAAAENPAVRAEIICDGLHVHPAVVRLAFSMFGPERMILVSDALRCCGMADGQYELGGQTVTLSGGVARLQDGTIAGSATDLMGGLRNAMAFGIREEDAIRAATYNPACAIGAIHRIGTVETGKIADFLVCNEDYSSCRVFIGGKELAH